MSKKNKSNPVLDDKLETVPSSEMENLTLENDGVEVVGSAVSDEISSEDKLPPETIETTLVDEKAGIYEPNEEPKKEDVLLDAALEEMPISEDMKEEAGKVATEMRRRLVRTEFAKELKTYTEQAILNFLETNTCLKSTGLMRLNDTLPKLARAAEKQGKYALAGQFHNFHSAVATAVNRLNGLTEEALNFDPSL